MRPENEIPGAGSPPIVASQPQQYATFAEVEAALNALTDTDHAKLMMIAISFCRRRRLARSVCEPQELLNQAVLKTLECEDGKRWNKQVSMVRHLDRAMENISGHLVRERMKIVAFPDGLEPEADESRAYQPADDGTEAAKVAALLKAVFGDDKQAKEVFILRADGFRPGEIQGRLGISATEYETANRRILRKISQYLTKKEN
jgi:DNA-directed RNA polymerase specialized sigma24 family protein